MFCYGGCRWKDRRIEGTSVEPLKNASQPPHSSDSVAPWAKNGIKVKYGFCEVLLFYGTGSQETNKTTLMLDRETVCMFCEFSRWCIVGKSAAEMKGVRWCDKNIDKTCADCTLDQMGLFGSVYVCLYSWIWLNSIARLCTHHFWIFWWSCLNLAPVYGGFRIAILLRRRNVQHILRSLKLMLHF